MINELVTIIIPVYKVEKFLDRCVESVINQTYKNLEIILVDDGSPDNCPYICEKLARRDSRIVVIHKKNEGLSSARNVGLDNAKGDVIYFIDSDDFIASNTIEMMVNEMKKSGADIVSTGYTSVEEDIIEGIEEKHLNCTFIYDDKNAFYLQKITNHAWGKLYKKSLFDEIRYPLSRNYEDIPTTHLLYANAGNISYTDVGLYYYRTRRGAITQSYDEKNMEDLKHAYYDVKSFYKDGSCETKYYVLTVLYVWYSRLLRTPQKLKKYRKETEKLIRTEFRNIDKSIEITKFLKKSKMTYKLLAYKYHLAKMSIHISDYIKRKRGV